MSKRAITWQHSTSNLILMGKRIVAVCPFNTFINCRLRSNYLQCAIMFFFSEELISNSHRQTLCCFENLSRCRLMKCFIWLKGKVVHSHYFGAESRGETTGRSWKWRAWFVSAVCRRRPTSLHGHSSKSKWITVMKVNKWNQIKQGHTSLEGQQMATETEVIPPPLCLNKNGGKAIRSGKKASCHFA